MSKINKRNSIRDFLSVIKVNKQVFKNVKNNKEKFYKEFFIKKANGNLRKIDNPVNELKFLQERTLDYFQNSFEFPEYYMGGIKSKSNITNANIHRGAKSILNLDIKDCFPSINKTLIHSALGKHLQLGRYLSDNLSDICSRNNYLPQGSPTSTFIANLVTLNIIKQLYEYTSSRNLKLTIFIDDITISGNIDSIQVQSIIDLVHRLTGKKDLLIKNNKVEFLKGPFRSVTGIRTSENGIFLPLNLRNKIKELKYIKEQGVFNESLEGELKGYLNYAKTINRIEGINLAN